MPGNVMIIQTRSAFKEYLKTHPNLIVKFTATWCGPCKVAKPIVEKYFDQCKHLFDMVIIDADNGRDVVNFLKVKAFPTICSFVDGGICHSVVGASENEILEFFKATVHKYMEK